MLKRIFQFFICLGSFAIFANQSYAYQCAYQCKEYSDNQQQIHRKTIDNNAFVFSELLYFQLRDGSAENWGQIITEPGATRSIELLNVPFKWTPGLRLGFGENSCHGWDTLFYYTWFQTKAASHAIASSGGVYSPFLGNFFINNTRGFGISGPTYRSASIDWKVLYNIVDAELGYTIPVDNILKLRPFVGLKGGSINHTIHSRWYTPTIPTTFTTATENLKNNFWGIGPSIGLNSTWTIYQPSESSMINIAANASGALLWGHWRFQDIYQNNTPTSVSVHIEPVTGAATVARGLLGIEWLGCISGANFSVRLGYEAQVWFKQVQFYSFNMGRLNNLMSLQGGVLSFNFYF